MWQSYGEQMKMSWWVEIDAVLYDVYILSVKKLLYFLYLIN